MSDTQNTDKKIVDELIYLLQKGSSGNIDRDNALSILESRLEDDPKAIKRAISNNISDLERLV